MHLATTTETFGSGGDYRWLKSARGLDHPRSATLDVSAFTEATHYPDGTILSGTPVSYIAASDLYGPFVGGPTHAAANEVQSLTFGGSGLTSYTLSLSGQTTASIDDAATADTVEAAIEALSNVGAGNVEVSGSVAAGFRVEFTGDLADTNVAAMTSTPTGGTGTVTVATVQAGGAGLAGFVWHDVACDGTNDEVVAILTDVTIAAEFLPIDVGLTSRRYITDGA